MSDDPSDGGNGQESLEILDAGALGRDQFEPHVGKDFGVRLGDGVRFTLVLNKVEATVNNAATRPGGGFSMIFIGPETPMIEQGNIILTDPDGRNMVLYTVNHGPAEGGYRYSVIVS